jgi:hypothetical protein
MNFADHNDPRRFTSFFDTQNGEDNTHLDVSDFFVGSLTIDLLIGDEYVHTN